MSNRTLGKLFTEWGLLGYRIEFNRLYKDMSQVVHGCKYDGGTVVYAYVSDPTRSFADTAHITFRMNAEGKATRLLHADIYFGDGTAFMKDVHLRSLEEIFNQ